MLTAQDVVAFWKANGAGIENMILLLIPSIITGLSNFPKTPHGVVGALQSIFDVVSFVSHRDSPGSFKLPLSRSQAPAVKS